MQLAFRFLICCVIAATVVAADPAPSGELCFGTDCRSYSCGEPFGAADTPRSFVFSPSRGTYVIGTTGAGATRLPCEQDGVLQLRIRVLDHTKPRNVRVDISRPGEARWQLNLTNRDLENEIALRLPRGAYDVIAEAAHFVSDKSLVLVKETPLALTLSLRAMRTIEGAVIDRDTRAAIGDARVSTEAGLETISGRNGRFVVEVDPDRWPKQLTVTADGYGTRIVAIPRARANTVVDDITLAPGATVVAEIRQTEPGQVVEVDLLKLRNNGRAPGVVAQTITLTKSDEMDRTIRFENVEPGQYVIMAKGAQPSQRAGERVDVFEWDTPLLHVQLAPFRLRLRTVADGQLLPDSRVILRQHETFWEFRGGTDREGEIAAELWQAGPLSVTIESPGSVPFRVRKTLTEAVDTEWLLEMPRLEVVGTVIDAKTREPVPNAKLALDMQSPERYQLAVNTEARTDGTFRFAPVIPGEHKIEAAAPGYPVAQVTYTFDESQETRNVTIALERQPQTLLTVIDARGNAVLSADVHLFRGATSVAFSRTGRDGTVPLFIPEGDAREVYVVPRDGSLGVLRVTSGTREVRLALADATSRIVVRTESETHEPIDGIMVDVRYNGFLLPDEVMMALVARGARITSTAEGRIVLDHMPSGIYELWAVPSSRGLRGMRPVVGPAPIRMTAVPGENLAVMTFARAENP